MSIYKPSLLDKFKDFVNGLRANWDDYESHKADYALLISGGTEYTATLENGWTGTLKYKKNKLGQVTLWSNELSSGVVTSGTRIAALPSEYLPIGATVPIPVYITAAPHHAAGIVVARGAGGLAVYGDSLESGKVYRICITYQT